MGNRKLDPLIERLFAPLGPAFVKAGVKPNHLTVLGALLSFGGAAVVASGRLRWGMLLLIITLTGASVLMGRKAGALFRV